MKKKIVLHIGSHKTATTFLQNSFAQNPGAMESLGILYPLAGRDGGAHFTLSRSLKAKRLADKPLTELAAWAEVLEEIDRSPHPVAVLSSEEFTFRFDPARMEPLKERYDVSIVHYLRSPESFMESFYNQFVKDWTRETRRIESYMVEEELHFLDTWRNLRPWAEIFGPEAVTVRRFGREFFPKGGILEDFLTTIGCKSIPEFMAPTEDVLQKTSLPPDALDYLRQANRSPEPPKGHYGLVVRLVKMALEHKGDLQTTRSGILSLKARQELRRRFSWSNAMVGRKLMGSARTPFPPLQAPAPADDFDTRPEELDAAGRARVEALLGAETVAAFA